MKNWMLSMILGGSLLCAPGAASAACMMMQADSFAKLNWGTAERFDGTEANLMMEAMLADANQAGPLVDLETFNVPKADTLYALPAGKVVLLIRVKGTTACADDPVGLDTFRAAKLRVLGGAA